MRKLLVCAAAAVLLLSGGRAMALEVGEKVPELEVTDWIQGEPLKLADAVIAQKVVVLVFWATFDERSKDLFPELAKQHDKLRGQGLDVVAVTTDAADSVREFLGKVTVGFRVAVDRFHNTSATYMKDVEKLPHAFVVDRTGTLAWEGEPHGKFSRVVEDVVAGKYDAKREAELERRRAEMNRAMWDWFNWDRQMAAAEKVLELEPNDESALNMKLNALGNKKDLEAYRKFVRAVLDRSKDVPKVLRLMAERLATHHDLKWRDIETAHRTARRVVELTKSADAEALDTLARVLLELGLLDEAIAEQRKAVALAKDNETMKARLAYYEACLAYRKTLKK